MWESVALTLAGAAGNNVGKVLQKKGTHILPPLSFKLKVIRAYAFNRLWISGFLMDMCGAALMLTALSQAPVSVVQPIAGCGLAILCVFSHFYLKESMNGLDWVAITLAGLGTIGVGIGGEEQKVDKIPLFNIPWLVLSTVILFVLLNTWLHIYKRQRREQELVSVQDFGIHYSCLCIANIDHESVQTGPEVIEEIIYGLESGILFGISSVISKTGFVMSEMGFPKIVVPAAISCSVGCSAVGFVYQTRGLKHGRAIVVSTCTSVASIVSGVVAGMIALDEHLPTAPTGRFFLLLGWFFIITGVILLVSSARIIARLPRSVQKFLKSNVERTHSIRRPGSARGKDPIPTTTIHASTLHLLTSPSKEKA
ncbi:probable magnesium transporter NIPA9 isoform X1 [Oryza brachyantha]|uniref:probable magnesium transporter NIPA9 isoform X1 n=1 Tax=Oryza brachyantha TaxID=4533 RepID=UPI001ADBA92F|nr:probable magnesium transporter NIPA9 isoform X1 [Oryza brachyantha]